MFGEIDKLKKELDLLRPLPVDALRNLDEFYKVEWTFHSNAIEGNTLTLLETKLVLEEGLTIGGKKLREHFEVINHAEAIEYINDIVKREVSFTENVIRSIHHLVLKNIDDSNAGRYRTINVRISGSEHIPPHFSSLPEHIEQLMNWFQLAKDRLHPVELAAEFHFRFVFIHPFSDGNGRSARLLMNFVLMSYGYPPAIVKSTNVQRLRYYETLEQASVQNKKEAFIRLIADCVEDSLRTYISVLA